MKVLKLIHDLFNRIPTRILEHLRGRRGSKEHNMRTEEAAMTINPPQRYVSLSMEQLYRLHSIRDAGEGSEILMKMAQFLVLIECDVEGTEYEGLVFDVEPNHESISKAMDRLEECLRGERDVVVLRHRPCGEKTCRGLQGTGEKAGQQGEGEIWNVGKEEFMGAVVECTKWLEDKEEMMRLVKLPEEYLRVESPQESDNTEVLKLPEFMMQNVSYQQYTVAQQFIEAFWKLAPSPDPSPNGGEYNQSLLNKLEVYQRNVMAALCVPTHVEMKRVEMEDHRGIRHWKEYEVRVAEDYTSEAHERVKEVMRGAPAGLFLVLLQYVQSCNNTFKSWYPQLFREVSDDKGEVKGNVIVAEQGTVLMLVQEGYFPNVEAVMNANVGYVLKALNTMNEKAEMTRDAMRSARK